jgi:hypothetical protein
MGLDCHALLRKSLTKKLSLFLQETDYKSVNGLQLLGLLIRSNELNYVTKYSRK